jgi:CHASE3 domain sensor protein
MTILDFAQGQRDMEAARERARINAEQAALSEIRAEHDEFEAQNQAALQAEAPRQRRANGGFVFERA